MEDTIAEFKRRYLKDGRLVAIPRRPLYRMAMDRYLASLFEPEVAYSEREVNAVLSRCHSDYAYLRRELVDSGTMERTDCGDRYLLRPMGES